jgi:beta-lactamase regulating signal transducer with metallopeptidase domain
MIDTMLLSSLWQGALVVGIAALFTLWVPQRNAATRYAVWFASLFAMAFMPLVSLFPSFTALPALQQTVAVTSVVTAKAATATGSILIFTWLAGFALCLVRLGFSQIRIDRIVRSATPAPQIGAGVMTSHELSVPIAARLFSPVIIIPAVLAVSLDPSDLASIVEHERAHIRRMDVVGNLIQRLIEACFFFNPWVYVIGRRLIAEREAACDDWAVHAAGEADRYASCLARLGQGARHSSIPLLTPSAIGSRRMLVGRIARLLNGKVTQLKINYFTLGASVSAFAILAVLLQTTSSLASIGTQDVAANPNFPPKCFHDVTVVNAAAPDIPQGAYHPNVTANALVTVDASGKPVSAKIVTSSGYAAIDQATVKAAMSSTYAPEMSNCKAKSGPYLFHVETGPPQP